MFLTTPKTNSRHSTRSVSSSSRSMTCSSEMSSPPSPPPTITLTITPSSSSGPQDSSSNSSSSINSKKDKKIEQLTALREMRSKSTNELTSQLDLVKNMVRIKEKKGGRVSVSFNFDDDQPSPTLQKLYKKQDKTFNLTNIYSPPQDEEDNEEDNGEIHHESSEDLVQVLESICIGEEILDAHHDTNSGRHRNTTTTNSTTSCCYYSNPYDEDEDEDSSSDDEEGHSLEWNESSSHQRRKHMTLTPTRTTKRKYAYYC